MSPLLSLSATFRSIHIRSTSILNCVSELRRRQIKNVFSNRQLCRLVLGIETSCDDTAAAVMDETGSILGESLYSQKDVHLKAGGIIPPVAQRLHREHIARVTQEALDMSGVAPSDLSAVATTVKPGLALSLGVGLDYSIKFIQQHKKPFIPIHHMEAHALTVRMIEPVQFPFLVLLVSGGHCLLAVSKGVDDFLLLGKSLDEAPGDILDKVARRLSLISHPECSTLSGGQAIEHIAKQGIPMGQLLSCVNDIAAAVQYTVASHIAKRTHRAILFCKAKGLLPQNSATLVVSGGVASNQYIRKTLKIVTDSTDLTLLCPPAKLCTDNGVMIAWNGIERLREGKGILNHVENICYEPKAALGTDISGQVREAAIKVPRLKLEIKE
ncbi:tRNA N6-adenosine threonylcarbamoyltransferase, mitochondrial isoform X2 [Amia ocellicauda]|uniref:tRNA N6-adenosine threonylcarbamoyltransferase, mitochondrial isoform X2 n=1 Tax=Amia ocellicauda TaxID=2972642 RepID=UPI003463E15C